MAQGAHTAISIEKKTCFNIHALIGGFPLPEIVHKNFVAKRKRFIQSVKTNKTNKKKHLCQSVIGF